MKNNTKLKEWEKATNELVDYFRKKYFGNNASDFYWIADQIGGVYTINDYFFNLSDIVDFIRYKYNEKEMFFYYDYSLDKSMKGQKGTINIQNWKKLKNDKLI